MTADELRPRITFQTTVGELRRIRDELAEMSDHAAFWALFPLATTMSADNTDLIAGVLLVNRDPQCPLCCEEAVRLLGLQNWQVSTGLVPLYFLMQFGKPQLSRAVAAFVEGMPDRQHWVNVVNSWACRIWQESFDELSYDSSRLLRRNNISLDATWREMMYPGTRPATND